ncbi:urb2 npa2 family protein [Ophiostoma piceae UAMH 11346]|uniref:Urb2 npa2 family protein n=1 Tax=Ophiostoma piceae (strain UAMH 11346) TaxID=1262450 RepID=S3CI66_OPHP1|nr:urb2 npa2 family protein [Ophiostoma piceae UAMH 11346]
MMAASTHEQDLVKAARSLDQSGPETVASKLQRLWSALVATTPTVNSPVGRFHASEEVALRWLLKNMHAAASGKASPEVETLRRWPLTWRILATLFRRIPLFSLAKSLADRRFVAILQQTARDIATPSKTRDPDAAQNKRKQTPEDVFQLDALSTPQSCLESAACLFEALGELVARLDTSASSSTSPYNHIGAEHIKSLFSVSATDAIVLLQPLLKVSKLAITAGAGERSASLLGGDSAYAQDTWITTFSTLWDFHMQGPTDAFEVASALSADGLVMIGHLMERTTKASADRVWLAGLRRFFTNNLVLPARSAFLNRGDLQALSATTASSSFFTSAKDLELLFTTIFSLALRAPRLVAGGGSSTKDNERWLQAVFEKIREAAMAAKVISGTQEQAMLLQRLLAQASASGISPSVGSLRLVCQTCVSFKGPEAQSSQQQQANWSILASVAQCDTDVFLLSEKDDSLLDSVLQHSSSAYPADIADLVSDFLVSLARGYAAGRNLPGFVVRWYSGIAALGARISEPSTARSAWFDERLRNAVAGMLSTSLTKEQFLALIAQVEGLSQADAKDQAAVSHTVARLVVFEAMTAGIRLEDIEDAVQTRMLDGVLAADLSSTLAPEILAVQWRLIRQTLKWVGFAEAERVWGSVKKSLKRMAGSKNKDGLMSKDKYEAFVCCFTLWMDLKFGGAVEKEARDITWDFFHKIHEEASTMVKTKEQQVALVQRAAAKSKLGGLVASSSNFTDKNSCLDAYLAWMFTGSSRFIDEMVKSADEPSGFLKELVAWKSELGPAGVFDGISAWVTPVVTSNFTTYQNQTVTSATVDSNVKCLEASVSKSDRDLRDAISGLLKTPSHLLQRSHRERIVAALMPPRSSPLKAYGEDVYISILDLLISVSQERAFNDLDFDRLVYLGDTLDTVLRRSGADADQSYITFHRYAKIAAAYFKTTGSKKESSVPDSAPIAVQVALQAAKLQNTLESAQVEEAKESLSSTLFKQLLSYLGMEQEKERSSKKKKSKKGAATSEEESNLDTLSVDLRLAVDAAMASDIQPFLVTKDKFADVIGKLKSLADAALLRSPKTSWKWAAFIARYSRGQDFHPPRQVRFRGLFENTKDIESETGISAGKTLGLLELDGVLLRSYLDSETVEYNQEAILSYIGDIVAALSGIDDAVPADDAVGQLLAVQYLLARLFKTPGGATTKTADDSYYLGIFHSKLSQKLPHARSTTECKLLAQTLQTLLADDKAAAAMGQWNVDTALSSAALLVGIDASGTTESVRGSTVAFDGACQLVEAVLKRHRVRLEGRFHLLVGTLQALLARLAAGHQEELKQKSAQASAGPDSLALAASGVSAKSGWAVQAKRFSRLLELVCEPSTAAVTLMSSRKGANGAPAPLHSATDAAKRSAGHHMYLVLMTYIKLQIDGAVLSHSVREALEPGLYSILTITPDETRRVLNDAVDASGRALFKDLYRKWLQFGKWKGV